MLQRQVSASICRSLRTGASATSRWSSCRERDGRSRLGLSSSAGAALREIKERMRPLGPGVVELSLDDDRGVATLALDNPERCNGESERGRQALLCLKGCYRYCLSVDEKICVVRVCVLRKGRWMVVCCTVSLVTSYQYVCRHLIVGCVMHMSATPLLAIGDRVVHIRTW